MSNKHEESAQQPPAVGDDFLTTVYRLEHKPGAQPMYCINPEQVKAEVSNHADAVIEYALVTHYQLDDGRVAFHLSELEDSNWLETRVDYL